LLDVRRAFNPVISRAHENILKKDDNYKFKQDEKDMTDFLDRIIELREYDV